MKYVFANNQSGKERLFKLHLLFKKSSDDFISQYGLKSPLLCYEPGCGPGFTTRLISNALSPVKIIGMENSEYFIEQARVLSREYPNIDFRLQDITKIPGSLDKADMIYFRFVLTHMSQPMQCIKSWARLLNKNGLLFIEETEKVITKVPVFNKYLTIADSLLKSNDNQLYIGEWLDKYVILPSLIRNISRISKVPASLSQAAGLFKYNIPGWMEQPFIKKNYSEKEMNDLLQEMQELESSHDKKNVIEWSIRQMVLQKE